MIIGPSKYSKDPSIIPEGIAMTLPVQFFQERGTTPEKFKPMFERLMAMEDSVWNFRLTNLPTLQNLASIYLVYLIFDGHIQYECNFLMIERNVSKQFVDAPDERNRTFANANWVLFTGPARKPSEPMPQKGFQGFRYTTKLF